jgi:hypothetical protein
MALPGKTCSVRGVEGLLAFIAGTVTLLRGPQVAGGPASHPEGWRCRLIVVGVLCLLGAADCQALADPKCSDSQPSVSASFDFVESNKQNPSS